MEFIRFYGVDIGYNSNVLTPRLETEALVQYGIKEFVADSEVILDIGTGSGAIIAAVANNLIKKKPQRMPAMLAIDISSKAKKIAVENFSRLNLHISCEEGDLLTPLFSKKYIGLCEQKNVLCFANLPYISKYEDIGLDVLENDPHEALFGGGENGFDCILRFLEMAKTFSIRTKRLIILLEFGHQQSSLFLSWCQSQGFVSGVFQDQMGIQRFGYCYLTKQHDEGRE